MASKYTNKSKLLGKIGTENYRVSNCPVHLPKENIKFFMAMQDAGNKDPFSSDTWGNQITPDWKKSIHESIVSAISKGIKNVLNESNGLVTEEECLRANLVCLYDHEEQKNFFIIKNPSIEDIKKIGTFHDRYCWHKKDTDDKKDRWVADMIQWGFYNIKLDGLTSIEYDDENINLCSFDLKNDEELYKFVYKMYLDKDHWSDGSKLLDRLQYVLNMIDQNILNKRDHYGFGIGTRLSFIEYFFKDYKDILDRYNNGDKEGDADWLKRIKEKEQILSSYNSFKSYMKEQVKKSVCAGDSSRATLLLNLKTEQIFDQAPKTKIHFIKTFQEYKDEMYKLLTKDKVNEAFDFNSNNILNEGSWGYEPNDGDGPLDMRYDINLSIFEKIYDRCKKDVDNAKKQHYASWAWDVIGQIEYFFDRATSLDNLADEPDKKFEKYDFWWILKRRKKKDILELYKEALDICENDKKWINDWKEPEKMKKSIKKRHKILDKYLKIQKQYEDNEKRLEKLRNKNTAKQSEELSFDVVAEGFMFEGECGGECGGIGGSYNTPMNTVGVGNVVPAQGAAMTGARQTSDMFNGSGDLTIPKSQKKSKKKKSTNSGIIYFPLATKKGV